MTKTDRLFWVIAMGIIFSTLPFAYLIQHNMTPQMTFEGAYVEMMACLITAVSLTSLLIAVSYGVYCLIYVMGYCTWVLAARPLLVAVKGILPDKQPSSSVAK